MLGASDTSGQLHLFHAPPLAELDAATAAGMFARPRASMTHEER
jgi:hypothetical protein